MKMNDADEILGFMHQLADVADEVAQRYFKQTITVSHKADATPVTEADTEIESKIRKLITRKFPSHGIWGEEFGSYQQDADSIWVIDPIDGTKAFMAGIPTFTTLIGLQKQGNPCAGMVSQAIKRKRWCAVLGKPIPRLKHVTNKSYKLHTPMKIATTSMSYFTAQQVKNINSLATQGIQITSGGDAYAYMMLAEGSLDAVFDVSLKPHDILPLLPILSNARIWHSFFNSDGFSNSFTGDFIAAKNTQLADIIKYKLTD